MDAKEFYRLRDDRTNRCVDEPIYARSGLSISIDDAAAASYPGQVAFILAANLAARWCRRIRLVGPDVPVDLRLFAFLPLAPRNLVGFSIAIAEAADPFGDFKAGEPGDGYGDWLQLHVGGGTAAAGAYRIQGHEWLATAGDAVHKGEPAQSSNPLGAALAACVGVAWAFRAALGETTLPRSVRLSLWNVRGGEHAVAGPRTTGGDLGLVALIGCGAVGSSMAYLLPLVGLRGRLVLIDRDTVDVTNLNRSPLFLFADLETKKAEVTAAYLRRVGLEAEPISMWFDEAVSAGFVFQDRPDVVVPTANDHGVRHRIQHQVPPLQVYGTTGRDWQAFLGRHIPLREDCLACRFPVRGPAEPPLACGTGKVASSSTATQTEVDAALPFLPTAAAILAVAELVKAMARPFPVNPNFACLDFRGPLADLVSVQRDASVTCLCRQQADVWTRLNGATRFADSLGRQAPDARARLAGVVGADEPEPTGS